MIHGSFGKHFPEIQRVHKLFTDTGITVLAPKASDLIDSSSDFALFADEIDQDPRLIELNYLHKITKLGSNGFSYFVNPGGYIGKSASYELAVAQLTNTRCFFLEQLDDHPAYIHQNSVWSPENLIDYITQTGKLPAPQIKQNERYIHKLWQDLIVPGSVVAAGAIIERSVKDKTEILMVNTHKWGNRYSIVGGKVRRNETLHDALLREVFEETGLSGELGQHLLTFDQIKDSGYYKRGVQHIFVDNVVKVSSKKVVLNDEAQSYVWLPADEALKHLDIEPNARATVEAYASRTI